jgi:ATP-binding cassette subfamily F protein 3
VLSGGERTRLAVARMLLLPSNTLVLDEPTNHLDLDSKDVLLDALMDYGGTLIFVSHDRYFVERLATKIVEVGQGKAEMYPGTYPEFLYRKAQGAAPAPVAAPPKPGPSRPSAPPTAAAPPKAVDRAAEHEARRRDAAERKKRERAYQALAGRLTDLEGRIAEREAAVKAAEAAMALPGFYDDPAAAKATLDRHQALMWEVGELLGQWEMLQAEAETMKGTLRA